MASPDNWLWEITLYCEGLIAEFLKVQSNTSQMELKRSDSRRFQCSVGMGIGLN